MTAPQDLSPVINEGANMSDRRPLYLGLGMLACLAILVLSVSGLVRTVRGELAPEPASSTASKAKPAAALTTAPALSPASAPVAIDSVRVPILMYHHLDDLGEEMGEDYWQLSVTPQDFREQMAYLKDNGYSTITFAELLGAFDGQVSLPDKPVIITFDDGWDDIYNVAYPILADQGMRATFFISTNWIDNVEGTVGWPQIKEMSDGGMEFGSHSATHPYLTSSEPDALAWELEASKAALEEHTGKTITALAYPFGLYDDNVIAASQKAGFRTACTIDPGAVARAGEEMLLPRLWVYGWYDLEDFKEVLKYDQADAGAAVNPS
jgi:peptidoglycan/xylan/chitin deacetylase (PgdA/CDA1 family)